MKHKNSALLLATVLSAAALPLHAANFSFDFEDQAITSGNGDLTSLTMTSGGLSVTITRSTGAAFDISDLSSLSGIGFPASFGTHTLSPFAALPPGDSFIATFSSPISAANISYGDFGADDDSPVTLTAFTGPGATGAVVDASSKSYPGSTDSTFVPDSESVSGADISSIAFTSGGAFPNSLFYDNLNVSTADTTSSVPDAGSSMSLLAVSLTGIAGLRRWIKRA